MSTETERKTNEVICSYYKRSDGKPCQNHAKFAVVFEGKWIGWACDNHARAYTKKALYRISPMR